MCNKDVCLEDFCGRFEWRYPFQYWADWCPEKRVVEFGGVWHEIPDMPAKTQPTEEQMYAWIEMCDPRNIEDIYDDQWYFREKRLANGKAD